MTFAIGALVGSLTGSGAGCHQRIVAAALAWIVGVVVCSLYACIFWRCASRLRRSRPAELSLAAVDRVVLVAAAGERLAPHHIIGALLGLIGTVLLFAATEWVRAWSGARIDRAFVAASCGRPIR